MSANDPKRTLASSPRQGYRKIMIIRLSTVLSVASLIGAFSGAPGAAGEWATKEEAIALVKRAVVVITERGPEKAYAEITKRFHDRDLYITVINLDGKVLAHGQRGNLVGRNLIDAKDPDGKLFIKERVELAREQSAFWYSYKWQNPATKEIEPQEAYCERLNDIVVCGGVYSF
jgi:cytochrome c